MKNLLKLSQKIVPIFFIYLFSSGALFADATSTNYAVKEDRFTGGGGDASSTNYQIGEMSFDPFSQAGMTSTNYAAETKVGIAGTLAISAINSITPTDYSKHYADESPSFTVSATDPDADSLQYRVKQDTTVKAGPQSSSTLNWALSTSDIGRHTFNFEVIDPDGTVLKPQAAYVYRRPTK